MSGNAVQPVARRNSVVKRAPPGVKKSSPTENGVVAKNQSSMNGERTVKKLRLTKALTVTESVTVSDACRRMAARKVDAILLTDFSGLLSGILTDKDISLRVIAEGLRPDQTLASKIMTRNPVFVTSDSLAIEALQKMVQGKFRHLPVVENGEVIALLDITKCLYDAISRMEKAAEQGSAIAAAVEGVERQLGSNFSAPYELIEMLRERMFKPSLATVINENTKVAMVSLSDPICVATKKMRDYRVNSVVIAAGGRPQGILTTKDVLNRVVAQNLSPELTLVEKVMTPDPECATLETTILDALHIMHDGKFLHLPVVDSEGCVAACVDVLQLTHAAISMVDGGTNTVNGAAMTMLQKFWDSALSLDAPEEESDTQSEASALMSSDMGDPGKATYPCLGGSFPFKFEDAKGRVHRFNSNAESLEELVAAIGQRAGPELVLDNPQLLYEDDEGDKVLISTDGDLADAVAHARAAGWKVLRLHVTSSSGRRPEKNGVALAVIQNGNWMGLPAGVVIGGGGGVLLAGICLSFLLRRLKS